MKMSLRLLSVSASCLTLLAAAGCVSTVDGKHTGGVPFVSDSVEANYDRPLATVWKAAKATLASNGTIIIENVAGNTLEAKVENRTVWIAVDAATPNASHVIVQVRTKMGGTDKALAADIDKQLALRLATGNFTVTPPPAPATPAKTK